MTDEEPPPSISENQRPGSPLRPAKIPRISEEEEEEEEEEEMRQKGAQRYLVAVEYIGTRFAGAQQQPNQRTVVGVLEDAFHKFIGQPVPIFCSSRTDAGVHALSNVCHVDVERISKRRPGELLQPHEPAVVRRAVNHFLQKNEGDIMVTDVRCVAPDFHARYKAQERTYFYRLLSGPDSLSSFEKDRGWHVPENLDILAMQKACKVLVGHHDFSSFRAASCQAKSPIRTLDELSVVEVTSSPYFPSVREREQNGFSDVDSYLGSGVSKTDLSHGSLISNQAKMECSNGDAGSVFGLRRCHRCYVVTARSRSFLYHQVRLLVGTIKSAGTGEITIADVELILNAKTVSAACPMAPACGLYLGHVKYDLP